MLKNDTGVGLTLTSVNEWSTNAAKVVVNVTEPTELLARRLNDTGTVLCGDYPYQGSGEHNNTLTNRTGTDAQGAEIPPGQDATSGRDVTDNDDHDGHAGFSFTKLSATSEALEVSATTWSCVKDNLTGLIWENKAGHAATSTDSHRLTATQKLM